MSKEKTNMATRKNEIQIARELLTFKKKNYKAKKKSMNCVGDICARKQVIAAQVKYKAEHPKAA
jgi:hypothetical protein